MTYRQRYDLATAIQEALRLAAVSPARFDLEGSEIDFAYLRGRYDLTMAVEYLADALARKGYLAASDAQPRRG